MGLVDVHAHFLPPVYREALSAAGIDQPDGLPAVPDWSVEEHVAVLDRQRLDTAVLSISSPGVHLGDPRSIADTIALSRAVNDVAAQTVAAYAGRFRAFASLPLPSIDDALAEAERALDGLGLDGVNLLTNVDGVYLSDASLEPLLNELDRRAATVFVHPTSPPCWSHTSLGYPRAMIEFPFDTTRAIADLALSGALDRWPAIRWIVPHAGGTLPFLAHRIAGMTRLVGGTPDTVLAALGRLHYDLAGSANPTSVNALLDVVDTTHVLYGSDWPFTPEDGMANGLRFMRDESSPVPVDMLRSNADALFPGLAG